jgi:hypothetical protein
MKTKTLTLYLFVLSLSGCAKMDINDNSYNNDKTDIYGEGDLVEKTLPYEKITQIEVTGAIDIHIHNGQTRVYTLKAQQNILDIITMSESRYKLTIGTDQKYNIKRSEGILLDITSPDDIDYFSVTGVSNIIYNGGHSGLVKYDIAGVGNINFNDFTVDSCYMNIAGVSTSYVTVNNLLSINIAGVGNVTYKGNAVVEQLISGVGTITKR